MLLDIPKEPIQTKNGERFLHSKKIPISDRNGNRKYLIGISEDITVKKLAEENRQKMHQDSIATQEAEKTLKLREEFISVASHE